MADVKLKKYGLKDIIYFTNKPKEREKRIQASSAAKTFATFKCNEKAAERHPNEQEFIIEKIVERGEGVCSYTLRRKDGENPAFFRAGQYVVIRQSIDGKLIARPVSISSGPEETLSGTMEVTVKQVPDGFLSKYILANWHVGGEVKTSGPQGFFYYEGLRDEAHAVACCGGNGITPVLSMAKAIASGDEDFRLTVLYGSRTKADILFAAEFAEIMDKTDKVQLVNVLSDEEAEGCEHGFITAELIKKYGGEEYSVFMCGPQAMYNFLDGEIAKLGLRRKFVRRELFGMIKDPWNQPGYPEDIRGKTFNLKVIQCGREYDITASADEPLLTSIERAGIVAPSRCRSGECSWCRSKLVSGKVFVPEKTDGRRRADIEFGYIHPCASFPMSDIVLDVPNSTLK